MSSDRAPAALPVTHDVASIVKHPLRSAATLLEQIEPRRIVGTVAAVRGLSVFVDELPVPVGSLVELLSRGPRRGLERRAGQGRPAGRGEVIGFDGGRSIVMLFQNSSGVAPGMQVVAEQAAPTVAVGPGMLGRVIDGFGRPIDGGPPIRNTVHRPLVPPPTEPLQRRHVCEPLVTGVRAIDGMVTLGKGQRVGVFSGPGVGKSTLLATIARNTTADVNVLALVGERGREVRHFIETALGDEGRRRSVVVVATGDESPLLRVRAAMLATAAAEHFRQLGQDVLLMMDSITRFAQAQRQIGLTINEQPAARGYTPSVFAALPVLLERAGAIEGGGSITGLYTVLVEGDDLNEPISDAARGILDGHIALSRTLAGRGHFPAIDLLESVSRVVDDVAAADVLQARRTVLRLVAAYADAEDLINIGAYVAGSDPLCDRAIACKPDIDAFLQQPPTDRSEYPETCQRLAALAAASEQAAKAQQRPAGR